MTSRDLKTESPSKQLKFIHSQTLRQSIEPQNSYLSDTIAVAGTIIDLILTKTATLIHEKEIMQFLPSYIITKTFQEIAITVAQFYQKSDT